MVTVPSFAKVNLYLRVLEREASGYHLIQTVLQTVALHDALVFQPLPQPGLVVESDEAPQGKANIVYRAAARILPEGKGMRIVIRKRIPLGAGLGGGSSNAAVTLLFLNSMFGTKYRLSELARMAGQLGADVPFFLTGGTALGQHYGEQVIPLPDAPPSRVALLYPGFPVATAEAYGNLKLTKERPDASIQDFCYSLLNHKLDLIEAAMNNDFEGAVFQDRRIASAKGFLRRQGFAKVHLTGSGSTLFALGRPRGKPSLRGGWDVRQTRFLPRSQYRRSLGKFLEWPEC